MQSLQHEVDLVSPAMAEEMLTRVRNGSNLDQQQIAVYARDMAAHAWKLNGDPLIFDTQGFLLSGRLRLHACKRAGAAFPSLIVRNVDPQHFDTIDAVRRRTVANIMSIRREKDGRSLAAALMVLWRFGNEDFPTQSKRISPQALVSILEEYPGVRYSVSTAKSAAPRLAAGLGGALHFLFARVDAAKADAFFHELSLDELDGRSPVALLKRQLEEQIREGGRRNQAQIAGLTIKAWEAFRHGRPMSLIRYTPGQEQFPSISGLPAGARFDGVKHSSPVPIGNSETQPLNKKLDVRVETITPTRAQEILDRNDRNRTIASAVVEKYARDMKSGAWALNGQTIKIGDSGRLLDGQHRCAAAIKANTSFQALVVEGLDDEVFDTFDLGTRRSLSAILQDKGETNTAVLAAALRHVWLIENGLIAARNVPPTVSELIDALERHPGIRESVRYAQKTRDISSSVMIALHHFFRTISPAKADEFVDRVTDGIQLAADSPIYRLRELLLADRANRKRRLSDAEKAALIIKAWNLHLEGRSTRLLKWQNAGERREAFPDILGMAQREVAE